MKNIKEGDWVSVETDDGPFVAKIIYTPKHAGELMEVQTRGQRIMAINTSSLFFHSITKLSEEEVLSSGM